MIFTIGGIGVWACVDFFISIFGTYTDSNFQYVDKKYNKTLLIVLFAAMGLSLVLALVIVGIHMSGS
jgi:hypothetical protein